MINIKELTVRNFMSVGNQTQAVNFAQKNLTLVLGENLDQGGDDSGSRNGTGKTTIVNALTFALYGNALTNIKKDNLVNKINNKGMLVTLAFEKDGIDYRIERGRKPNILQFFVNDQAQETAETDGKGVGCLRTFGFDERQEKHHGGSERALLRRQVCGEIGFEPAFAVFQERRGRFQREAFPSRVSRGLSHQMHQHELPTHRPRPGCRRDERNHRFHAPTVPGERRA